MKLLGTALLGALALAACAPASESAETAEAAQAQVDEAKLAETIAHERRAEDSARDAFRHPAATLAFFQVAPEHTVIEYAPGGGWYSAILAPYLAGAGQFIAVGFAPEVGASLGEGIVERIREGNATFSARQAELLELPEEDLPFYVTGEIPTEVNGTVDRVLVFRMMHNLKRWGIADSEIEALFDALKPGGLLGVVQHRAKPDAPEEYVDGNNGYLKQDEMIAFFEGKGFELVDTS